MSVWNGNDSMESAIERSFPGLKDFPKGLRVLVVDSDEEALDDAKLKLEACDYIVTMFSSGHEAWRAVDGSGAKNFHLAVVAKEETTDGLELVSAISTRLPTILISQSKNMATMMEGIAAGASEVLAKPLKTDQLRTIWQHVFRKALGAREEVASKASSVAEASEETCASVRREAVQFAPPLTSSSCIISMREDDKLFDLRATSCESSSGALNGIEIEGQEEHEEERDADPYHSLDCNMFLLSSPLPPPSPHYEEASSGSRPDFTAIGSCSLAEEKLPHSQAYIHERDPFMEECSIHSTADVKSEPQDYVESSCVSKSGAEKSVEHSNDTNLSCDGLEFDCNFEDITLSNNLADELIPELDLDSAMLDDLNSSDGSLALSFDCLDDLVTERSAHQPIMLQEACDEEALLLAEVAKAEACITAAGSDIMGSHIARSGSSVSILTSCTTSSSTICTDGQKLDQSCNDSEHSSGGRSIRSAGHSKKKTKVDWTPELHRQFVQAVEQLGVDKAIPSKILEVMGVEGLTRHNIASHLQKYRSHKKHMKASREPDRTARTQRQQMDHSTRTSPTVAPQQAAHPLPSLAQPLTTGHYHVQAAAAAVRGCSNNASPAAFAYPLGPAVPGLHVWGHPSPNYDQFWPINKSTAEGNNIVWHQPPSSPSVCLGHPTHFYPQPILRLPLKPLREMSNATRAPLHSANVQSEKVSCWNPMKEAVDAAISEVLKNPFTPLPLGLKPPAWDSVVSELQRQGIRGLTTAIS